jgi:hypothetical protein
VYHADETRANNGGADLAERPGVHCFFGAPRSAGVSEPQAATIFPNSAARAFASAGSAKRMKRALGL